MLLKTNFIVLSHFHKALKQLFTSIFIQKEFGGSSQLALLHII